MKLKTLVATLAAAACAWWPAAPALASDFNVPFIAPTVWNTPLNRIAQVACHNCYQKQYAPTFTSALNSVRTVEVDFWDQQDAVSGGSAKHWFVRHDAGTLFQSGNDNNCTGDGTGKNDLQACLNDIKAWSDANAAHFPIIVVLDKKQGWSKASSQRTPADLDELVSKTFGSALFTPADLKNFIGSSGALQTDIAGKAWPSATALAGKIILVLNHTENQRLSEYAEARGASAKIFISPVTNGQNDVNGTVSGMSATASAWVAMNNMQSSDRAWAVNSDAAGHIGRVWGDDGVSFADHIAGHVQLSAYYDFAANQDASGFRIRPF
ncbi:Ca2+-dependent phosphoinositide-specific phospholipase C [Silvimonas iriomotensis]|uniref:Phosphoinositide phospholipase C, Ca2+-dependent n=1 Tax=Silvimonas iriomotensis TaxID=449662 RepID=A0ABQ2PAC5_9NEIS|nr:Ca2+-dependent phosphoinositide-specific phospholipase C [Silvimonas iriomotensis]GGP22070.1 hypothetical protein GCM10010970_23380 [Silvimonas iriomotensis]